jgi:hypothetical protein
VAGLDTPSLRELHISTTHFSSTCHIPSLSMFIRVAGIVFFAAISGSFLMTFLFSRPHSIDDPPTKVVTINAPSVAHLDSALSAFFTTLEDIFISMSDPIPSTSYRSPTGDHERWRKFFEELRNVCCESPSTAPRTTNGICGSAPHVHSQSSTCRRYGSGCDNIFGVSPINSNGSQFTFGIFPLLEKIVVYEGASAGIIVDRWGRACVCTPGRCHCQGNSRLISRAESSRTSRTF